MNYFRARPNLVVTSADDRLWLDKELLRHSVDAYDFDSMHATFKSSLVAMDTFLFGGHELALVLLHGDVSKAREGWSKQVDAWKKIRGLVESGERSYSEYCYEGVVVMQLVAAGMLAADAIDLLRQWMAATWMGAAIRDPAAETEMRAAVASSPFPSWENLVSFACLATRKVRVLELLTKACAP
jgi:hypothetical protein